jgi:hypothetical protein
MPGGARCLLTLRREGKGETKAGGSCTGNDNTIAFGTASVPIRSLAVSPSPVYVSLKA